jgi:hypothetical protein
MLQFSKRQKISPPLNLNFFQWITVFFNSALECDMPILESLYHTMFLHLDLATAMNPDALYAHIREHGSPSINALNWSTRLKRLAVPKLEYLFPKDSPFRNFHRWFGCACFSFHGNAHFPQRISRRIDTDFWLIRCSLCADSNPETTIPLGDTPPSHWDNESAPHLEARKQRRDQLRKADTFILAYYEGNDLVPEAWVIVADEKSGEYPILIKKDLQGFLYQSREVVDLQAGLQACFSISFPHDFLASCIIISQPEIPLHVLTKKDFKLKVL